MALSELLTLLILFQVKHFIADYITQTPYMLQKFRPDWGFFFPLLQHSINHAGFTMAICLIFAPQVWWLSLVDLVSHFIMDRIKAGPKYLGKYKSLSANEMNEIQSRKDNKSYRDHLKLKGNKYFWWSLGLDQMTHHLCHYYIIFMIVMQKVSQQ